jgi:flap endonuclease-1
VLHAPHEAEEECARLCLCGEAEWVITEDIDALTFGAPLVLRGITTASPTLVTLATVLGGLDLTVD